MLRTDRTLQQQGAAPDTHPSAEWPAHMMEFMSDWIAAEHKEFNLSKGPEWKETPEELLYWTMTGLSPEETGLPVVLHIRENHDWFTISLPKGNVPPYVEGSVGEITQEDVQRVLDFVQRNKSAFISLWAWDIDCATAADMMVKEDGEPVQSSWSAFAKRLVNVPPSEDDSDSDAEDGRAP
ncbi:hypothetical protein WJX72_001068 [[Myrmecia] bisecta]|uniref:Uncharacterized protein n=1 Tax=[Myrmecia] bisecta TaxID=41462 RepID=A0AAW1PPF3_9CHLO